MKMKTCLYQKNPFFVCLSRIYLLSIKISESILKTDSKPLVLNT